MFILTNLFPFTFILGLLTPSFAYIYLVCVVVGASYVISL